MGMSAWPWSQLGRGAERPDMDTRTTHFPGKAATKKCWVQSTLQCPSAWRGAERTQTAEQEWLSPTLTAPTPHPKYCMSLFTCARVSSLPLVRGICWGSCTVSDKWMKDVLFFVPHPHFRGAHFSSFIEWRKKTKFPITCAARTP